MQNMLNYTNGKGTETQQWVANKHLLIGLQSLIEQKLRIKNIIKKVIACYLLLVDTTQTETDGERRKFKRQSKQQQHEYIIVDKYWIVQSIW